MTEKTLEKVTYMISILLVAAGGALGAVGRYSLSLLPWKGEFPLLTLLANFLGATVLGFLSELFQRKLIGNNGRLFLQVGLCGGFTTFSTFSLETVQLFENGKPFLGGAYILVSVTLCLLGVGLGRLLANLLVRA